MMSLQKEFLFNEEARRRIFEGIKLMYDCVSATLGSYGKTVLIDRKLVVDLTKDGVSVAEEVVTSGWAEMGCKLAKVASQNTNEEAGDGTTTTVVLAKEMCENAISIPKNIRVLGVKEGITLAIDRCVEYLREISLPVESEEDYRRVAKTASQDDKISKIVTKAFLDTGENGTIDVERSDIPGIQVEKTEGISFEKGYLLPMSVNERLGGKDVAVLEDVPILVTDEIIKSQSSLIPIMKFLAEEKFTKKLFIIADEFRGDAIGVMAINLQKGTFQTLAVRAPSYGHNKIEILKDICAATGATFISRENGGRTLETVAFNDLGTAEKVICERERTIVISPKDVLSKKKISDRIDSIKLELETEKDEIKVQDFKTRLATLTDGITTLKVGGQTEQERREYKHRVEDAVRALQSARSEGIVPGEGIALLRCIDVLEEIETMNKSQEFGLLLVKKALSSPIKRIFEVAGLESPDYLVSMVAQYNDGIGYDFETGQYKDLLELGIYDATKVVRSALQNAASVAKNFLSLDVAILVKDSNDDLISRIKESLGQ